MNPLDRQARDLWARRLDLVGRHPDASNAQVEAWANKQFRHPFDVDAARIALGFKAFDQAEYSHDEATRLIYGLAWIAGIEASTEVGVRGDCWRGVADVVIYRPQSDAAWWRRDALAVVEVKTGTAKRPAVVQVERYRSTFPERPVAALVAPQFASDLPEDVVQLHGPDVWPFVQSLTSCRQEAAA